jgi:hypothetical protein
MKISKIHFYKLVLDLLFAYVIGLFSSAGIVRGLLIYFLIDLGELWYWIIVTLIIFIYTIFILITPQKTLAGIIAKRVIQKKTKIEEEMMPMILFLINFIPFINYIFSFVTIFQAYKYIHEKKINSAIWYLPLVVSLCVFIFYTFLISQIIIIWVSIPGQLIS